MSEPQNSGALAVEMAGLDVIPESDRKGKPSDLFMPWFAANISVLGISWGSWVLGFGLSLTQAVIVSVVGVALSFLVCGLIAIAGKRGSAPTLVLSRAAFGFNGNRISAAISWILTVGWETFLAIMAVQATATVMGALGFTNHLVAQVIALILVALAFGDSKLIFGRYTSQTVQLDRAIADPDELKATLEQRLGASVASVNVVKLDLVNDLTLVDVRSKVA